MKNNYGPELTQEQQQAISILKTWFAAAIERSSADTVNNIWLLLDYVHNDLQYIHKQEFKDRAIEFIKQLEASGRAQYDIKTVKNAIFLFDRESDTW